MNPKDLLSGTLGGLWDFIKGNDYFYFFIAVVIIVLAWKVVKASAKTLIKIAIVLAIIYLVKKFLLG